MLRLTQISNKQNRSHCRLFIHFPTLLFYFLIFNSSIHTERVYNMYLSHAKIQCREGKKHQYGMSIKAFAVSHAKYLS